ncbi:MAG: hypothetical protein K2H89_08500, partial [Oscillospiraceae bacterium]|nr:hypothetical protein [Oscillospiraceae bacterium]
MKKRILISTLIALILGVVQPMGAVSLGAQGYAETTAQETDATTDDGAVPSSADPENSNDTIRITETGEIVWLSDHARADEITTFQLSLEVTGEANDVIVTFPELYTDTDVFPRYKVEESRYDATTGRLDIFLVDSNALFIYANTDNSGGIDSLTVGTITIIGADGQEIPTSPEIVRVMDNSAKYVYQNELTVVTVEAKIETTPEIVIQEETTVETTTAAPETTTVATTSTVEETTTAAQETTTVATTSAV